MRENRPIFQKLAPVICKEDDQQDFYVNNIGLYNKTAYVLDKPCNRQVVKGNTKQISNEGIPTTEPTTPKKWNSALKKIKCETLGFYLDRATNLLAKNSNANSGESSNFSSFKEPSFTTFSCERKETQKLQQRVSMKDNKNSILSMPKQELTRKSMVSLTPNHNKGNKLQYERKTLKSFDTTPFKKTNNYYMNKEVKNTNKLLEKAQLTVAKFEEIEGSINKDATELKEFIELEDFCRRTTVADSKQSWVEDVRTQKSTRNSKIKIKTINKCKANKAKKVTKNLPSLIKTFAITISNDNIMYS